MTIYSLTTAQLLMLLPDQRRYDEHLRLAEQHSAAAAEAANAMVRTAAFAYDCRPEQVDLSRLHEGVVLVQDGDESEKVA